MAVKTVILALSAILVITAEPNEKCGENEEWIEKCTGCELKCGRNINATCEEQCKSSSCWCSSEKGFRRDENGKCIPIAHCQIHRLKEDEDHGCAENERWIECSTCEAYCGQKEEEKPCPASCGEPRCECLAIEGFVRTANGTCVKVEDCPASELAELVRVADNATHNV